MQTMVRLKDALSIQNENMPGLQQTVTSKSQLLLCELFLQLLVHFSGNSHHWATHTGPPGQEGRSLSPVKSHTKAILLKRCK